MSQKKAKATRKIEREDMSIELRNEIDRRKEEIERGEVARAEEIKERQDHWIEQAQSVADQYRSIWGYMESRDNIKAVAEDLTVVSLQETACNIANLTALGIESIIEDFKMIEEIDEYDGFLGSYLEEDVITYIESEKWGIRETAAELQLAKSLMNLDQPLREIVQFAEQSRNVQDMKTEQLKEIEETGKLPAMPTPPQMNQADMAKIMQMQ